MPALDPRFTFENFVVGPSNRLAAAAARRSAENPGGSYNPLFVYAASGLGKTHILGAVAHLVARLHPDKTVLYQTVEGFLGELAQSIAVGDRDGMRGRYATTHILLLDDVQFLAGQSEAQEMLLRLLDSLTGEGKQVVLASDRPPAEIDRLDARLRSRFEGGLLVDIGPPEYETRVAIIRRRAESRGLTLAGGVAEVVGRVPFRNVRELAGAVNRIFAIQELEGRLVSPEEAAALVGQEMPGSPAPGAGAPPPFRVPEVVQPSGAGPVEEPWRWQIRQAVAEAEEAGFRADRLRRLAEGNQAPADLPKVLAQFRQALTRLAEIRRELEEVGNPWPEAAHGVLRDPERLEEAEALLASARERARPFPPIPPGPTLAQTAGKLPSLVLRAAEQLVTTTRPEYNPLYVWGGREEALRLLLEAAGRSYLEIHPTARVALLSVNEFAEDFIGALSAGVAGAWRERWWSVDLLLIAQGQQLAGTEQAQDEFFHLFEALQRRKARILVTADRPPGAMPKVDDRLRSRFEGGLVLELEPVPQPGAPAAPEGPGTRTGTPPEALRGTAGAPGPSAPLAAAPPRRPAPVPPKATPPGAGLGPSSARGGAGDVAALDRDWIRRLQAPPGGVPEAPGPAAHGAGGTPGASSLPPPAPSDARGRPQEKPGPPSAPGGFPRGEALARLRSPETVVQDWPRVEDRLVEDLD